MQGKYLSLTSFRRDGTGVATPVWFVPENGRLLIETDADSYKVRRMRRNPEITIAPCTARGRLLASPVPAHAAFLPDAERERIERLMASKYRFDVRILKPIRWAQTAFHIGRGRGKPIVLAITPAAE